MSEPVNSNYPTTLDDNTSLLGNVANLKSWVLSGNHTSGVTTITVTATISGVNAPLYIRIENEVIHAAGISGNTFTGCTRGADGTSQAAHNANVAVYHTYTANYFNQLKRAIIAIETALGAPLAIAASAVSMPKVGSPTIDTLAEDFTTRGASGVVDGTLTYIQVDTGSHKIKVAAGEGYLRTTNDQQGDLKLITWPAMTQIDIPAPAAGAETTRFIGIEYNSGTPQVTSRTSFNWNWYTDFPLGRVSYDGTTLRILNAYAHAEDTANLVRRFLRLNLPFQRETAPEGTGGLVLSEVATRQLAMTTGNLWHGLNTYVMAAITAGTAFTTYYRKSGGGFNATTGVTQWPNTQYDDGSGALVTMTNNKYAVLWVYLDVADGALEVVYGRNEYTSIILAQAEALPATVPDHMLYHSRIIGRIVFQKSASAASVVESAFSTTFSGTSGASIFNDAEGDPADLAAVAADGTSGFAARRDHVHKGADLLSTLINSEIAVTGAVTATIGCFHKCSGTSADYTVTLPAASGNAGKFIGFRMETGLTKLVTLDGNASEKIDNALTRIMWANETAILLCDGSNWIKVGGKSIPMIGAMHLGSNQTGIVTATPTKINMATSDADNTGLMVDTTNKKIIIRRPGVYFVSGLVVWSNLTAAALRLITMLYLNGAQYADAEIPNYASGTYPATWANSPALTYAVNDYIELYGYHNCGSNQAAIGAVLSGGPCQLAVLEQPTW